MDEIARIEAEAMMSRYIQQLRDELGPVVEGVYLVGSYALEDMRTESDVDFVTVLSRPLQPSEQSAALRVHTDVSQCFSRSMDGLYAVAEELRSHPHRAKTLIGYNDGRWQPAHGNPADWVILRRHGIPVYGTTVGDLRIYDAAPVLPPYSRENLAKYWAPWVARAQAEGCQVENCRALAELAKWVVLGVPRLHAAIATGELLSKTGAGLYALETFDAHWFPVVKSSLTYRAQSDEKSMRDLAALCEDALSFAQMVIAEGQKLPS